jgi:Flp pilus assembly protein TadG
VRPKARCRKSLRQLRRDASKGSAAIEFAFIAPVFFVLLMGTIEAALIFFAQATLQNAVSEAGRLVRTGQVQSDSLTQDQFRTKICTAVSPLLACDANLTVDVESFNAYGNLAYSPPLDSKGNMNATMNKFAPGAPCNVVLVRAFYTWRVFSPGLDWFLVNMAGNHHLLSAASAFRNEPFTNNVAGC